MKSTELKAGVSERVSERLTNKNERQIAAWHTIMSVRLEVVVAVAVAAAAVVVVVVEEEVVVADSGAASSPATSSPKLVVPSPMAACSHPRIAAAAIHTWNSSASSNLHPLPAQARNSARCGCLHLSAAQFCPC